MNYEHIEMLIKDIKEGDNSAKVTLFKEFKPYILAYAKKVYIKNYEIDDIINECYIALLNSIESYDCNRHRFVSYGTSAIKNQIKLLLRNTTNKDILNNDLICNFNDELDMIDSNILTTEEAYLFKEKILEIKETLSSKSPEYYSLYKDVIINKNSLTTYSCINNIPYSKAYKMKKEVLNIINSSIT